ncbi:G1 family glutamic endopeptidase [Streptomyces sp. NPDC053086]|uniref:G1 family glutamic endopeptidase n=1 Tax=unclassified Streptomyces TaxID=2593676 RepID=UPI0037D60DC8
MRWVRVFRERHRWSPALALALLVAVALPAGCTSRASADPPTGVISDPGFEAQPHQAISAPWSAEGPGFKGIDIWRGYQKTGDKNAFIRTSSRNWNAITQRVPVHANTNYVLDGWVRTSGNYTTGYFGARTQNGKTLVQENYGIVRTPGAYQYVHVAFNSGVNTSITVFIGYVAPGTDSWVQIDDVHLSPPYGNWAGYVVPSSPRNTAPTAVTATWIEPSFPCVDTAAPDHISVWVGLDGLDHSLDESLVQVGTSASCDHRDPTGAPVLVHQAFWEVINGGDPTGEQPVPGDRPVAAGDTVSASVVRRSSDPTTYVLTLSNLTRHWTASLTKSTPYARSESAEIITEEPGAIHQAIWPRQLSVPFSYVTVDGDPLDNYEVITQRGQRPDTGTVYEPSRPTSANGFSAFTLSSRP